MTPREEQLMAEMVRAAVAEAVAPLRAELEQLKVTDRKHSGVHREVRAEVSRAKTESLHDSERNMQAVAAWSDKVVGALNELRDQNAKTVVPAAKAAERAANQSRGAALAVSVDTESIEKNQRKQLAWWRHPALPIVLAAIVEAIFEAVRRSGHG